MSGSYEKINYSLRPAKVIERKMLCETFRKLSSFGSIESYRYIGFGSTYFSDFKLFHRSLGIHNMISIENEDIETKQRRFEFNKPFHCIEMRFGHSNDELTRITNWDIRTIIWLDYDDFLNAEMLADIEFIFSTLTSGSLIVVTVNAHPPRIQSGTSRLDHLENQVGKEYVPHGLSEKDLAGWGTAKTLRRIMNSKMKSTLQNRNAGRPDGNKFEYKQIFNFCYEDGAKMLTIGGMLIDKGQLAIFDSCEFTSLEFIRVEEDPYHIKIPNLTYKELTYLDTHLPTENLDHLKSICSAYEEDDPVYLPPGDVEKYNAIYRYFPNFAETDV